MQKNALNALIQAACIMNEEQFTLFYENCIPLAAKQDILEARNKYLEKDNEISKKYEMELAIFTSYEDLQYVVEKEKMVKIEKVGGFIEDFENLLSKPEYVALRYKYGKTLQNIKEVYEKLKNHLI